MVRSLTARVHSRTPGALETIASCTKLGITVNPRVTLRNDASSFKEAIRIVQDSHVKVLIFFGQQSDGKKFFLQAVQRSFLGPGVTAITADAFNVVLESNLENDYGVSAQQLRGTFGLSPDRGKGTPRYDAFSARFKAQPSTAGSVNGTCHPGVDADGGRLFAKDHDEDPATPDVCTGVDFAALTELNSYSGYAYTTLCWCWRMPRTQSSQGMPRCGGTQPTGCTTTTTASLTLNSCRWGCINIHTNDH